MRVVRSISSFDIRGDAWTWWASAEGDYGRSAAPARGSVMVFKKTGRLNRGHVSLVSAVLNDRTILVDHSWLGGRGLRRGMRVEDVSPRNDWTQVRVWHEPARQMGQRVYPIYGFIMPKGMAPSAPRQPDMRFAVAPRGRTPAPAVELRSASLKIVPGHKPGHAGMMVASLPQPAAAPAKAGADLRAVMPGHKPGFTPVAMAAGSHADVAVAALVPARKPVIGGAIHAQPVVAMPDAVASLVPARKPAAVQTAAPTLVATAEGVRSALPARKPGTPLIENEQVADAFWR
ncbi:hypothetical protein M2352_004044 [Azospirillum fermentarium]|uniref:CHAP domain-containing protein n=1 Tax=Azospirillum fermentarium TaxID=1233114 RepID=UPI0022273E79|nr:CHAP domain-containing protein [Azospirillum fermentarium]MCW2248410.1 hypothetical protein [Azospirillum fermentarium]